MVGEVWMGGVDDLPTRHSYPALVLRVPGGVGVAGRGVSGEATPPDPPAHPRQHGKGPGGHQRALAVPDPLQRVARRRREAAEVPNCPLKFDGNQAKLRPKFLSPIRSIRQKPPLGGATFIPYGI